MLNLLLSHFHFGPVPKEKKGKFILILRQEIDSCRLHEEHSTHQCEEKCSINKSNLLDSRSTEVGKQTEDIDKALETSAKPFYYL